jgi:acetylornithine deacetylase
MNLPFQNSINSAFEESLQLLQQLISTPSFSREENLTADIIENYLKGKNKHPQRHGNNIWVLNQSFDATKPCILLNSHHDTVKPNQGYTKDPFEPLIEDGKIYGLGSNDAGGCLVSLIGAFLWLDEQELPCNLILTATAEEEISGQNGIASILDQLPIIDLAIVGEPTLMQAAVAEKGLMVVEAFIKGKAGHAARSEGENAIYKALDDLNKIQHYKFKKTSPFLGETKATATIIEAGSQHNVVPDLCKFVLDVRVTDAYTLEEALNELKDILSADLQPRSLRLNSSSLPYNHPIHQTLEDLSLPKYGSPTLSDQALIPYPSIKIGPGDSARSHTADEFIFLEEIKKGIEGYVRLLEHYLKLKTN